MKEVKIPGEPIILIVAILYLAFYIFDYGYKRMLVEHTFINIDSIFSLIIGLILLVTASVGIIVKEHMVWLLVTDGLIIFVHFVLG